MLDNNEGVVEMSLTDQIWLSVVDKSLLGGIVALGGFYGTRAIEAYKAKQVLRTELTKQRVSKIEDVWRRIFDIEAQFNSFRTSLTDKWIIPAIGQTDEARLQGAR